MSDPHIHRDVEGSHARYSLRLPDSDEEAELTYVRTAPQRVVADHTFVPESMRGQGVGGLLVTRLLEDASKGGFKVLPQCPYVKAHSEKHPDQWKGLLAE